MAKNEKNRPVVGAAGQNDHEGRAPEEYTRHSVSGKAVPAATVLAKLYARALEEERRFLGCILFSGRTQPIVDALSEKLIRDPRHERIASAIAELHGEFVDCNLQTVADVLGGELTNVGGPGYLASLTSRDYIAGREEAHLSYLRKAWQDYESARIHVAALELLYGEEVVL